MEHSRTILQFPSSAELTVWAAETIIQLAEEAITTRGRFSLALSGGGTPSALYKLLADEEYASKIDWSNAHIFWGDERCVPPTDSGSNYLQAMTTFLTDVGVPTENIYRVKGELSPEEAAEEYKQQIACYQGDDELFSIDCILLGMGTDGHTASLFPNSQPVPDQLVISVVADYEDRPATRVSLTAKAINQSPNIFFLVTGEKKAEMVKQILYGDPDPIQYPSQRISPINGHVYWLLDEGSAKAL